jgi:tripartite-type tricarboxylate transporter receptor subunit TctC
MLHVPYKGSTPGRVAVAAGEANLMFDGLLPSLPLIKAGKLRALGVTAAKRLAIVPDIPAIAETVPGFNADTWNGIMAPRGTPPEIIAKIQLVIAQALQQPEVREKLLSQGGEPSGMTPAEFAAFLKVETAKWGKVVRDTGARPE